MLSNPKMSLAQVGKAIGKDPGLGLRIVSLANSAAYAGRPIADSVETAARIVGVDAIKNVVLQMAIIAMYEHICKLKEFNLPQVWRHSILTASICSQLTRALPRDRMEGGDESMYTCGLIHDIGKVVLYDSFRSRYVGIIKMAEAKSRPLWEVEEAELGYNHADVCRLMASNWHLPDAFQASIAAHHDDEQIVHGPQGTSIVNAADRLAQVIETADWKRASLLYAPVKHLGGIDERAFWTIIADGTKVLESLEL